METKIHFTVKVLCTAFIFYRLWLFIFSRQAYDAWEKVYRMMRFVRIKLWKCRKEYRYNKAEKARENTRRGKTAVETKAAPCSPSDDDVIGRTKIVYLEDPNAMKPVPAHSEPLAKGPIEEDEEINPDDVAQESKGLTKEEMEELMAPVDAEPDSEFSTAMTFEEMNNVAEVLASGTQDKQKAFRASMTIYHKLSGTEILNLLEKEIGCQQKIECLLNKYLDESGRPLAKRKPSSKGKETFDINKYT